MAYPEDQVKKIDIRIINSLVPYNYLGINGAYGVTGDPGEPGLKGPSGSPGSQGYPGKKGIYGQRGDRGLPGKCSCFKVRT